MADEDSTLKEARDAFDLASDAEGHNRETALADINFARLEDQWPADVKAERDRTGRPCLTINKLKAFISQVVNDSRQNKPSIKVHPVDSDADPETAELLDGLIRNIEYTSDADVAFDTAVECAVTGGFGYWRVGVDYAYEDAAEQDLRIMRVANPFAVYGDPNSRAADSSDWDCAFVVDRLTKSQYETQYKGKDIVPWDDEGAWSGCTGTAWRDEDSVMIAEYWTRELVDKPIVVTKDGKVFAKDELAKDPDLQALLSMGMLQITSERIAKAHKVTQRIMSGAQVLKTTEWRGKYIPIVPVYGDEFDVQGKRYFRSLIHSAIDAQRMFNYWRTVSTELVALAPRVPFIGPKGAFDTDQDRWQTVNTQNHPYLEYDDKGSPPQRQPMDSGVAAGALQEALNASDDMKAIIGLYDASLGARSNETSGKAIMARQREGDIATFHFIDNLSRAIRHTGRILIDLIPKYYDTPRMIRVLGEDGKPEVKQINQPYPVTDPKTGQPQTNELAEPIMAMHDLTAGKYDLTVKTGPSFTSRREEAAFQMTEMIRAFPEAAPIVGPELAKNLDWPGADKIAEKMEQQAEGKLPEGVQQKIDEGMQELQRLKEENAKLKMDAASEDQKIASQERLKIMEIQSDEKVAMFKAQSDMRVATFKAKLQAEASVQAAALRPAPKSASQNA